MKQLPFATNPPVADSVVAALMMELRMQYTMFMYCLHPSLRMPILSNSVGDVSGKVQSQLRPFEWFAT